jgi:hypothetical protein
MISARLYSCSDMGGCVITTIGDMHTVTKPGRYHLGWIRMDYTAGGRSGWQYQNLDYAVTAMNPPRPNLSMLRSYCPHPDSIPRR